VPNVPVSKARERNSALSPMAAANPPKPPDSRRSQSPRPASGEPPAEKGGGPAAPGGSREADRSDEQQRPECEDGWGRMHRPAAAARPETRAGAPVLPPRAPRSVEASAASGDEEERRRGSVGEARPAVHPDTGSAAGEERAAERRPSADEPAPQR